MAHTLQPLGPAALFFVSESVLRLDSQRELFSGGLESLCGQKRHSESHLLLHGSQGLDCSVWRNAICRVVCCWCLIGKRFAGAFVRRGGGWLNGRLDVGLSRDDLLRCHLLNGHLVSNVGCIRGRGRLLLGSALTSDIWVRIRCGNPLQL